MANPNQDRLRTHFASLPPTSQASGWDSLWKEGTFIPWDRGTCYSPIPSQIPLITRYDAGYANPALIDFLAHPATPPLSSTSNPTPGAPKQGTIDGPGIFGLPSPVKKDGTRRKALVPGCGKGYDVALLASYGYDAYGLEVSPHAADKANAYLKDAGKGALEGEYNIKDEKIGQGMMVCLLGDYFEDAWVKEAGAEVEGGFDVIYDNTVSLRFLRG
jgi:SAM-dependent methyltransferase